MVAHACAIEDIDLCRSCFELLRTEQPCGYRILARVKPLLKVLEANAGKMPVLHACGKPAKQARHGTACIRTGWNTMCLQTV